MKKSRAKKIQNQHGLFGRQSLVWVLAFAAIATVTLLFTHADSGNYSFDAEDGIANGSAQKVSAVNASNNMAVKFMAAQTGGGMELVSRGVPLYTATNSAAKESLRDTNVSQGWDSVSLPSWAAFDLSSLSAAQKQKMLISIYAPRAPERDITNYSSDTFTPRDYAVEVNSAAGGGTAPASGWTSVANSAANNWSAFQHTFSLTNNNWVRLRVNSAKGDPSVNINVEIYTYSGSLPSDSWLFMGDSITHMSAAYWQSDLQKLVSNQANGRWPAVIEDGIGGSGAYSAPNIIAGRLASFPGKYVVLGYGTNDYSGSTDPTAHASYPVNMEKLINAVIAAEKTPVIPHIPWSSTYSNNIINQQIDALYAKYPQIVHGPDLWQVFYNRTDFIPTNDVHPNEAGVEVWRQAWADVIAAQPK